MVIRNVSMKDTQTVFKMLIELRRSGYAEMGESTIAITAGKKAPGEFEKLLWRDDVIVVMAEEGKQAMGLLVAYEIPKVLDGNKRMLIEELVVLPKYQGKGVGKQLVHFIETLAYGRGIRYVKVATGTKLRANGFYQNRGYTHFENSYRKKLE